MELRLVSALLAQHRGKSGALKAAKSEEELTFRSVKVIALSFLTICLGLLIALVGPKVFGQESSISSVGGYIFLAGLAVCLFASFHLAWTRAKPRRPPAIPEAITQPDLKADAADLLQSQIPSITESTTRLMDDDIAARPRAQESSGRQTG
jgi:hypothetical protein